MTLFVVGIFVVVYILISIPAFTNAMKDRGIAELTKLIGSKVEIANLTFSPFNEMRIEGLEVYDLDDRKCLEVEKIGAGISLWKLIFEKRIEITYGEIIGLNALIVQEEKDSSLNISFIIDAFSSKDKNKEKTPFDLALRNVVLRKSGVTFSRPWLGGKKIGELDLSNLIITDLAADIAFPKINEKEVHVDLRRLSLKSPDIIDIEKLGLKGEFGSDRLFVQNFVLEFPNSKINIPELNLPLEENVPVIEILKRHRHVLQINNSYVSLSDFGFISPILKDFSEPLFIDVNIEGNVENIEINTFKFGNPDVLTLSMNGGIEGLSDLNNVAGDISDLELNVTSLTFHRLASSIPNIQVQVKEIIGNLGDLHVKGDFSATAFNKSLKGNIDILSDIFNITFEGGIENPLSNTFQGAGELNIENLKLDRLLPKIPIGNINANLIAEGTLTDKNPQGMLSLVVEDFEYKGKFFEGFSLNVNKDEELIAGDILIDNAIADLVANFNGDIESPEKNASLDMDIRRLDLSELIDMKNYDNYTLAGNISLNGKASGIDFFTGDLSLNNFSFVSPDNKKKLKLNQLEITGEVVDSIHSLNLKSDWMDFRAEGPYQLKTLPQQIMAMAESVFPILIPANKDRETHHVFTSDMEFDFMVKKNNALTEFFNLPFRLLVPVTLSGSIDGSSNSAFLNLNVPYLQQGKDKLIYDTKLIANIYGDVGVLDALIETTLPVKKGDLSLNVNLFGRQNSLSTDIHWINTENADFKGHILLDTDFSKNELTSKPEISLEIKPSILQMGTAQWQVSKSNISYTDKKIEIDGLRIWHDDQFVEIQGVASPEYSDAVTVKLADIDVDYVFDMLQINYVTFGGTAMGEVAGRALLSGDPIAETESIIIKDFTYNGCQLGTCFASSKWNNEQKEIEISADISHNGIRRVFGSGGIWLGKDSLCFDIEATKVPVDFVQPFMAVFSSHVGGYATGAVKLFGTFHDIDMTGKIFADSVAVKLDYTNTVYHGSDSVLLYPGRIEIPHFELFDKNGNSAMLSGELTHRYFHDPSFTFRLSDAEDFLCYNTSSELNPDWYGVLYGTGSAFLRGEPGLVDISADMTITGNSSFTFVLNDTQYAQDYEFLTFSDKRKEEAKQDTPMGVADYKEMLKKRMAEDNASLSRFGIDIRATVTPHVLFTLVMDPAAGDKITARGRGAMQVKYESDDDEMMMYGKYEIDEGNYNFSLQDIILRDFKIKEGSYISFNGNPLAADLDISATYRVNTNLSDLDKSFSTDRDLNRTNVPVDAVLSVNGNMTSPDITFDIELPTLTQDVERKVKSIISTDDMMNRQIIYLLALNRFYTPEYMGATGNGGELAAVASSTISSQLSNILGQLTDKFSVSPSIRSDKGDFSDIEVDVALSSKLLNNRLLINGNFGYRDRSNSSTTFVGDFDVEYLLSKNGNLRLKAYNHFNDQNYYLREALTTQGLGVVYRRDFDNWFTFLKKRSKQLSTSEEKERSDDEKDDSLKNDGINKETSIENKTLNDGTED
ncbi:MAG: translocation/assembly module TamB domain-containing protein [Muribaculaceae bacterium]|nr:translocation/assembly module TamB domain-containing protein [Muribaculaceae bacterium]